MHSTASHPNEIAVVGMGCWYPGANNLQQLWENIVARRQQFRRSPNQRLPISDYYDPDPDAPDKTYGSRMAVIDGFEFDWVKWRIPKSVVDSADIAQWLALEVAIQAAEDAGYNRKNIPTERTGVLLGNTLTGEFSRSTSMRMRWPYVRRALVATAQAQELPPSAIDSLVETMEAYYKSVFSPITEDTLAGNLSNTIAGRVCNFFNFHGGGYTVDGACSSSLIAVANAATALMNRDLDLAFAGGVDISLDTFELIGFAKTGALTGTDMKVYDRRASGFIPGEGCGFVVLKRLEDARADGNYIYAVLKGWGISSDGKGGITAPNREGQAAALRRAYDRAGYSPHTLDFVEGHGTGTVVGDRTELEGIALAMRADGEPDPRSCGITSFKSLVGHTKAAAGIGAFIKSVMAVNRRVIPPVADCQEPNAIFETFARSLYPILQGEVRPQTDILRAGVSAMGFGGINCHVTLESGDAPAEKLQTSIEEQSLLVSNQDTEIFVLSAESIPALLEQTRTLINTAEGLSFAEVVDLAAHLSRNLQPQLPIRAALIAGKPEELVNHLTLLEKLLHETPPSKGELVTSPQKEVWVGNSVQQNQIGFLFPGQGSQKLNMGRWLVERYPWARELVEQADIWLREAGFGGVRESIYLPLDRAVNQEQVAEWSKALAQTAVAQPAISLASLLWLHYLKHLGIKPVAVGGHSLGELTAFHAAGAFDEKSLLHLAAIRGQAMSATVEGENQGAMASLACSQETAENILKQVSGYVVLANINSPKQMVISGESTSVEQAIALAQAAGIRTHLLPVSNAFHSQLVATAAEHLRKQELIPEQLEQINVSLFSSVDGQQQNQGRSLREHFANQILAQVDFVSLVKTLNQTCDLLVEVGPGKVLSGLVSDINDTKKASCFPVESKPGLHKDLHVMLAAIFVRGNEIKWEVLYENRLVRPFVPVSARVFIENPVERPFQISADQISKISPASLETLPSPENQVPWEILSNYISQRGRFLTEVIRADLQTLSHIPSQSNGNGSSKNGSSKNGFSSQNNGSSRTPSLAKVPQETQIEIPETAQPHINGNQTSSVENFLVDFIVKQTGFPQQSVTPNIRLLDDLNLDSIKAGELIAATTQQFGVAGKVDPASMANATIQEIAEAIRLVMPQSSNGSNGVKNSTNGSHLQAPRQTELTQTPERDRKPRVRDYIVRTIAEASTPVAFGNHPDENWQTANAVILCESAETAIAEALCKKLRNQGAQAQILSFATAQAEAVIGNTDFTHFIAVLPQKPSSGSSADTLLLNMIERLRSIATPPPASQASRTHTTVAYIQFGGGHFGTQPPLADIEQCCAIGFASSLHLERPDLKVRVIDFSTKLSPTKIAKCVTKELATSHFYLAAGYDATLKRYVPRPQVQEPAEYEERNITWSSKDVILVTGGAKGITAECALALAKKTGVRMALVGRSPLPDKHTVGSGNAEVMRTLERFSAEGLTCLCYSCDVADPESLRAVLRHIRQDLGEITGIIHGAALNWPRLIEQVSTEAAFDEIKPKLKGILNLCQEFAEKPLKLFAGFSSVIGITGMQRNAWYGFSNEALDLILRRFKAQHPETAVVSMAFSVWEEVGMGARMGSVRSLNKVGIKAIPKNAGVARFLHLIENEAADMRVVVAAPMQALSAFETSGFDTWFPERCLPPKESKFLERVLLCEPGVEMVARAHLSLERDSYLLDHLYKGSYLFPTVFGLEAMAQAVAYVTGKNTLSTLEIADIRLERPIVVDPEKGLDIEIHAEVLERESKNAPQEVCVTIKTEKTGFNISHFSATFVLGSQKTPATESVELPSTALDIRPQEDLYSWLLFQGPRFQRLQQIYTLDAEKCVFRTQRNSSFSSAQADNVDRSEGPFLLGDPYYRDSLLQAGQLLIPQDNCLPVMIERIEIYQPESELSDSCICITVPQGQSGKQFRNSVVVITEDGRVVEKLSGYEARLLEHRKDNPTVEELADPQRRDEVLLHQKISDRADSFGVSAPEISLAYLPEISTLSPDERHTQELPLFYQALGKLLNSDVSQTQIHWSASGKPMVDGVGMEGVEVSLSHDQRVCLCVAGQGSQGCDIEPVSHRSQQDWNALLSEARQPLMQQLLLRSDDSGDLAGMRIWTAVEALRKAIGAKDISLRIAQIEGDSVLFRDMSAGSQLKVLTFPVQLTRGSQRMVALIVQDAKPQSTNGIYTERGGNELTFLRA
ncbi:type I polyketide synthase [Fischerella thermalis CCMEE 5268]|uniref:Type I polyketide synthase n=1 Tax=Fischerella thermalis CCMEE 5268 TaxID=2019662 RepID=A0A2N6KLP5_9CYAN|nr:type I polyketide synthase [Fischerella thermalis]PMB00794.1 type I polyketide synthase [Fischerella thermalis CCMEE 5268]